MTRTPLHIEDISTITIPSSEDRADMKDEFIGLRESVSEVGIAGRRAD